MQIQFSEKQFNDVARCYDLFKADSGIIEAFFLKPAGENLTRFYEDRKTFIKETFYFNSEGYSSYIGIQPRKRELLQGNRSGNNYDVVSIRYLYLDLDPARLEGSEKANVCDQEKQNCLKISQKIQEALRNGSGYQKPILTSSGNGYWLLLPIPEIPIIDANREEMNERLKVWGSKIKNEFSTDGIVIDTGTYDLRRLTKIPGTRIFDRNGVSGRPQRIAEILSAHTPIPDKKLRDDFLSLEVNLNKNLLDSSHTSQPYNPDRIIHRCYTIRFFKDKGNHGISLPHRVRLSILGISLALGDLENNLNFIKKVIGGCPDFNERKTRYYLKINKDKSVPYGCKKLRALAEEHFRDFDTEKCNCTLPPSFNSETKNYFKSSPIRYAYMLPEDLEEVFNNIDFSENSFERFNQLVDFANQYLSAFDTGTAQAFLESKKEDLKLKQKTVEHILRPIKSCRSKNNQTQAQILIEISKKAEIFHDRDDIIYATFEVDGHKETWPLNSIGFRRWIKHQFYQVEGKPPGTQSLQEALGVIEATAQFEGQEKEVFIRLARSDDAVYIDLVNKKWEAIEIRPDGWEVIPDPPVKFRRTRGMMALPKPVEGTLEDFKPFLNLQDPDTWPLIAAWVVAAANPKGPYPILIFQGEQGAAKSTTARMLKALLDPNTAPLRVPPRENRDLMIAANNGWIISFDNLSALQVWISDALCRLSTGGGFSTRQLYSDGEEIIFHAMRPVILNGISDIATRHDLADRSIIINLQSISEEERKSEREIWAQFEKANPRILGAICVAVSAGLKNIEKMSLPVLPRMADFALWVTAVEEVLPWKEGDFMKAYTDNMNEVIELTLDADPVAAAVCDLMNETETWESSASELLVALEAYVPEKIQKLKIWPKRANVLSGKLKRAASFLRTVGIEVVTGIKEGKGKRKIVIRKITKNSASCATPTEEKDETVDIKDKNGVAQVVALAPPSEGVAPPEEDSALPNNTNKIQDDNKMGGGGGDGGAEIQSDSKPDFTPKILKEYEKDGVKCQEVLL
jgi:hypothetical protein